MNKYKIAAVFFIFIILGHTPLFSQQCHPYTISWNPVTDPNVEEICVYRSRGDFSNPILIATLEPGVTDYTDNSSLSTGVVYCYGLKSSNSSGVFSAFSSLVSGLTLNESSNEQMKSLCRIDSVSVQDDSTCTVYWSSADLTTGFVTCRESGGTETDSTEISGAATESHSAVLTGLQPNESYILKAVSYSEQENNVIVSAEYPFITEIEGEINFVLSSSEIEVDEGSGGQIILGLDSEPVSDISVTTRRVSGDSTLNVSSGGSIVFSSGNWESGEIIEISAAEDIDCSDGMATFVIQAEDGSGVPIRVFTVSVIDDDDSPVREPVSAPSVSLYPQPFNPDEGALQLTNLPEKGELNIYNLTGNRVWNTSWSGTDNAEWDGVNSSSTSVSSGRYFVVIKDLVNNNIEKKAILVVR